MNSKKDKRSKFEETEIIIYKEKRETDVQQTVKDGIENKVK